MDKVHDRNPRASVQDRVPTTDDGVVELVVTIDDVTALRSTATPPRKGKGSILGAVGRGIMAIAIMDNDRMAALALRSLLSQALPNTEILPPVGTGAEAIRLCCGPHPPALLLADIAMNDINGPTVTRTIRKENATTAILGITSSIVADHAEDMAEAGAQGIVSKNEDLRLLALAITTVAGGGVWPDETSSARFSTVAEAHRRIAAEHDNGLSARETEVVELWAQGLTAPRIAERLGISETTVRTHLNRATRKLGVSTPKELIAAWLRRRML